jgi:enoyl-CoA hydratase
MEKILYNKKDHIGMITISCPESLNILNSCLLLELNKILDIIKKDNDIYCVVITGAGQKSFIAGAEIKEMKDMDVPQARKYSIFGSNALRNIELLKKPVIAAINGYALGGGLELAVSCDLRIASKNSVFGFPEVTLGIIPGWGGMQKLVRLVGLGRAKEITFTGSKIDAEEAFRIGLINKIVEQEALMEEALSLAGKIAGNAPVAVSFAKAAINHGIGLNSDSSISYELEVFAQCFATEDQKDAMDAFINKKKLEKFKNK